MDGVIAYNGKEIFIAADTATDAEGNEYEECAGCGDWFPVEELTVDNVVGCVWCDDCLMENELADDDDVWYRGL